MKHGSEQSPFVPWEEYKQDPDMRDGLTMSVKEFMVWEREHCACGNCYPPEGCKDWRGPKLWWHRLKLRLHLLR